MKTENVSAGADFFRLPFNQLSVFYVFRAGVTYVARGSREYSHKLRVIAG